MNSLLGIPVATTVAMVTNGAGSPAVTGGSLANLLSNRVGSVARFGTGAIGTYFIDVDLGVAKTVGIGAALWSNLRAGDTYRVTGGATLGATSVDTGAIAAPYSTLSVTALATKSLAAFTNVAYRYWRFSFTVNTTPLPEGYLQVSRLLLAEKIDFAVDYSQLDLLDDDRGLLDRSDYGEDIEDQRRVSFGWRVRWRYGTQAEMIAVHQRFTMLGTMRPAIFCPIPAAANAQDLLAFGKIRSGAKTGSQTYDIWEMGFDIYSEAA